MQIKIRVIPNSSKQEVKDALASISRSAREENGILKIHLNSPPLEGRANKELIGVLAKHFKIKKSQIKIIAGTKSRDKTVQISM